MRMETNHRRVLYALVVATILSVALIAAGRQPAPTAQPPAVGEKAPDFTLRRLDGKPITLSALAREGSVVLIMLRGWVGYQCPICNRQVGAFLGQARAFEAASANVVLVYPGAADLVQTKAEEFVTGKTLPASFHVVVDPDLKVVKLYHLRWDAPGETAYPSTFVLDRQGVVRFAKISHSHGDRSSAPEVLQVLEGLK